MIGDMHVYMDSFMFCPMNILQKCQHAESEQNTWVVM